MSSSKALFISHIEALQNVVNLHKASANAELEEVSSYIASNAKSVEEVGSSSLSVLLLVMFFVSRSHLVWLLMLFHPPF